MDELVLQTQDLTKRYGRGDGGRLAVDRVSMTVRRGEVFGFLGPNGAGKTTTLRMLVGLVRPTAGVATVLGEPAGRPGAVARIGALIEGPGFYPYLTGRDNLRTMARYRGLPDATAEESLDRVDLGSRGADRFRSYSLGMKQRLGVAAALMGDPELIILDEPTNGLDPAGMTEMRALIVDLARGGQTVLLSSHLLAEVEEICDRVGVIDRGRLLVESTVSALRGGRRLRITATPLERAIAVATRIAGEEAVQVDGAAVVLDVPTERTPEVARGFVDEGLDLHEVRISERTLEDVFLEMTDTSLPAPQEQAPTVETVR